MKSKEQIREFLKDLKELYLKHDISIGHEDTHGAFEFKDYDESDFKWISYGFYRTGKYERIYIKNE